MTDVNGTPPPYSAPTGNYSSPAPVNPGKTLGIVAFVLAILFNIVGAIVGIIALVQSRKAGQKNGFALAAIIIGVVTFIGWIIIIAVLASVVGGVTSDLVAACQGMASGTVVTVQGQQVACP